MEQQMALAITLVVLGVLTAVVAFVLSRSGSEGDANVYSRAGRLRNRLFVVTAAIVLPTLLYTLFDLPYAKARVADTDGAVVVNAQGQQWAWNLDVQEVPVNQPVLFKVTSIDTNHGFGIYDPSMRLVAQTQAMPGYVNKLVHTFDQPGTYKILCLEFCGTAHHAMQSEVRVVANQGESNR